MSSDLQLASPVTDLNGVGKVQAEKFARLGIKTIDELINYWPLRYEDFSQVTAIAELKPGRVSLQASIRQVAGRALSRGMYLTEAIASDKTGSVRLLWFNQPYRAGSIKLDQTYFISGNYELSRQRFAIMNPSIELATELPVNTARILAIYRETKGLTSRQIRLAVAKAFTSITATPETLPGWIVKQNKLIDRYKALRLIHQPKVQVDIEAAKKRLGFEEVFELTLASLLNKYENQHENSIQIDFEADLAVKFARSLPFKLTDKQRLITMRIYKDLARQVPMNRLVEGDVGSGKTVIAAMTAIMVLSRGWQAAFMAPTELLARQHAESIYRLLKPLGLDDQVVLLAGSLNTVQKNKARQAIANGRAGFIIGTQALIQDKVDMHKLALIIIDEQHRFGVEQRQKLMAKAGHMPHVLSLSATPIPRSLALTLYGELDISVLDEKPFGRQPIKTEIIPPSGRIHTYKKVDQALAQGRQAFVVCPLITDDKLTTKSVEAVYKQLNGHEFKHRRVGLLHGRLSAKDKQKVMNDFVSSKIDLLVTTTVIEVGVDVPNATIMLVENAERFGLAQLHQLRGRVGRGVHPGHCFLMLEDSRPPSRRLRALARSSNGFELAELDLELRGPGAIYGYAQHGVLDLRIAKLTDTKLISLARQAAQQFIDKKEHLLQYKHLSERVKQLRAVTNLN